MSKMRNILKKWQKLGKVYTSAELGTDRQDMPDARSSDCENEDFSSSTQERCEVVVFVGKSRRQYMIDGRHLRHPLFRALWKKSVEEFGVDQSLGISLGCEVVLFEYLLWMLNTSDPSIDCHCVDSLNELTELYMPVQDSITCTN